MGRRVRVRRAELDRVLAQGSTVPIEPEPPTVVPAEVVEELTRALERARRLLGRVSGARRADLLKALQDLADDVAAAVLALSDDSSAARADTGESTAEAPAESPADASAESGD